MIIGLVVEGSHDYIMLDPFIRAEFRKRLKVEITYRFLQPTPDSTGRTDGGWSRVIAWCLTNKGAGIETFFNPLFAGEAPCDVIIVHLDGDSLEHLHPHTAVTIPLKINGTAHRLNLLTRVIHNVLAPHVDRRKKLAFAFPVLQTEAWILSAEGFSGNVEAINSKAEFRKNYPRNAGGMARRYEGRVKALSQKIPADKCQSYRAFAKEVAQLSI